MTYKIRDDNTRTVGLFNLSKNKNFIVKCVTGDAYGYQFSRKTIELDNNHTYLRVSTLNSKLLVTMVGK